MDPAGRPVRLVSSWSSAESKRADRLHLGRNYAALRDWKRGPLSWTFEAGDAYFTRALGEYGFSNLTTPSVTFSGGAISVRTDRGVLHIVGGRATAWRNIFGTDPDTLAQTLGMVRGSVQGVAIASRCSAVSHAFRTSEPRASSASTSRTAARPAAASASRVVPAVQLIADGSCVRYRRLDSNTQVERRIVPRPAPASCCRTAGSR